MLFNCVVTYIESDQGSAQELEALLAEHGNQEVQDMFMTWAEKMEAKGYDRGRQELEGALNARRREFENALSEMRELVLRTVKRRFSAVPRKVARRISEISSHQKLTRLAEQVQKIDSLDQLDLD